SRAGRALLDRAASHRLREAQSLLQHNVTLPIERDHVIAVLEHNRLDATAEIPLEVVRVSQARAIVLTWMQDQRRLRDAAEIAFHSLDQLAQLEHRPAGDAQEAGLGGIAAVDRLGDDSPQTLVLDAVGRTLGEPDQVRHALLQYKAEQPAVPGNAPAIELEGWRIEHGALDDVGVLGRQPQRQDGAH